MLARVQRSRQLSHFTFYCRTTVHCKPYTCPLSIHMLVNSKKAGARTSRAHMHTPTPARSRTAHTPRHPHAPAPPPVACKVLREIPTLLRAHKIFLGLHKKLFFVAGNCKTFLRSTTLNILCPLFTLRAVKFRGTVNA